jgi:hypothetical protein
MSTNALNAVYKTAVVAIEESILIQDAIAAADHIHIAGAYMSSTPFVANQVYVLRDDSFATGTNGLPNAERVLVTSIAGLTSTAYPSGHRVVSPSSYATISLLISGEGLTAGDRFFTFDGTDSTDGALATAKGSAIVAGDSFLVASSSSVTSTATVADFGYLVTGSITVTGFTSAGWTGGLVGSYTKANNASVLTPGQEVVPTSTDFNCRFKTLTDAPKIDFDDESSRFATGDEGRDLSIAGARSCEINFTEKLAWGGAVSTVPKWAKLMKVMGHLLRKWTTTGIEILPLTHANEITATVWITTPENGMSPAGCCYRYVGAHGGNGCSISGGKIGDPYMLTGKLMATYIGTQELTLAQTRILTAPETSIPEVMLNNVVSVPARVNGSTTSKEIEISQFSLDFGGVVNPFINQKTSTGFAYYATQDRDPKLTMNPYHVRKSLDDIDYIVTNMITGEVSIKSAVTSPHITIFVPNAQLLSPALAAREGYVNTNRTYRALRNNLTGTVTDNTIPDQCMYSILIGARA